MKVYTVPCHDRGHINVVVVLQSCACHIGNMNVEEDVDMQVEEGEVNVKIEKDIGIKDEGVYGEEEDDWEDIVIEEEDILIKEEDIQIKEEEDIRVKEEVSLEDTV